MSFKSDIEIAQETTMQPITEVAKTAGIDEKYLDSTDVIRMCNSLGVHVSRPEKLTFGQLLRRRATMAPSGSGNPVRDSHNSPKSATSSRPSFR